MSPSISNMKVCDRFTTSKSSDIDNGRRNSGEKQQAPESVPRSSNRIKSPNSHSECRSGSKYDADDTVFHDAVDCQPEPKSVPIPNELRKWKRIDKEKGDTRKEEVDKGKPFVFKTKSWFIKPGEKKKVRSKIKLAKRDFSGYMYVLKDPKLRDVVPRQYKFQARGSALWSTTEYHELLEAYKDEIAKRKEEGEEILGDNKGSKSVSGSAPCREAEQSQELEMENKASDTTEVLSMKLECLPSHHQKMLSDQFNTIAATIAATESEPSSENGRQGQMMTGFMKLLISGGILLCLTGITLTSAVLGIIFFSYLIMISSPIWVPIGLIFWIGIVGFLWVCGIGAALIFGSSRMYKYLRGTQPLHSDWVECARNWIMGTAGQSRDHTLEGSHGKVKDVAPGAKSSPRLLEKY